MATKDRATVGLEVILQYDEQSIQKALNTAAEEVRKKVDIPNLAGPIQATLESYISKLSNAFGKANSALKALDEDVITPGAVATFSDEVKLFKEVREEFRKFVKSTESITGLTGINKTIQYINEFQTIIASLGNQMVTHLNTINSNYFTEAAGLGALSKALEDLNKRIATFNKNMADTAISQGIIVPLGGDMTPQIVTRTQIEMVEVTKLQIDAIKANTEILGLDISAKEAFMEKLAAAVAPGGPGNQTSENFRLILEQLEAKFASILNKFAIFDLETGAHLVDGRTEINPVTGKPMDTGLEMITSMAIKLGEKAIDAFKVDFSKANVKTEFFYTHLLEALKGMEERDLKDELTRLIGVIEAENLTLVGFNNKNFDNNILLDNIKALGDNGLFLRWKAAIDASADVMLEFKNLLLATLPKLVTDPGGVGGVTGTGLDAIRAILLQMNQAHLAFDDVVTTKLALLITTTDEGRKLFNDIMINQGGVERWIGIVTALLTDKFSKTQPLNVLGNSDQASALTLKTLIEAMGGLQNFNPSQLSDLQIPTHIIRELEELALAWASSGRVAIEAVTANAQASLDYVKTLKEQNGAAVSIVKSSVATAAAITGLSDVLVQLKKTFLQTFNPTGITDKNINEILNPSAVNTLATSFGVNLEGLLNQLFVTLNANISRAITSSELQGILEDTKATMLLVFEQLLDDAKINGELATRAAQAMRTAISHTVQEFSGLQEANFDSTTASLKTLSGELKSASESLLSSGYSILKEDEAVTLKFKARMNEIGLLAEALVGGLTAAINKVLAEGAINLTSVTNNIQLASSELSAAFRAASLAAREEAAEAARIAHNTAAGRPADTSEAFKLTASMLHMTIPELLAFKEGLANGSRSMIEYNHVMMEAGNTAEEWALKVLESSGFVKHFTDMGQTIEIISTQARLSVGAWNFAIDALMRIAGRLTVVEIKLTDNVDKVQSFLTNPANPMGKQWLAQGLFYAGEVERVMQEYADLWFILLSNSKDAVTRTGDVIREIVQIDRSIFAAETARIRELVAFMSNMDMGNLNSGFEDPGMKDKILKSLATFKSTQEQITIAATAIADDAVKLVEAIQIGLKATGGTLEELYMRVSEALAANHTPPIADLASKFFGITNLAKALDKLMTLLVQFDGANTTATALQVILTNFRNVDIDDTGFTKFLAAMNGKVGAIVDFTRALNSVERKLMLAASDDISTLRNLISALMESGAGTVTIEAEYMNSIEALIAPIDKLAKSLKKAAVNAGNVIPPVIGMLEEFLGQLDSLKKSVEASKASAMRALAIAMQLPIGDGSYDAAIADAQKALQAAFARQATYLEALANFQKQNFDQAIAQLQPTSTGENLGGGADVSAAQQAIKDKLAKFAEQLSGAIFSEDLLQQIIRMYKAALTGKIPSIQGMAFNEVVDNAIGTVQDPTKLIEVMSILERIGRQLAEQAALNIAIDQSLVKETATLQQIAAAEERITANVAAQSAAEAGLNRLLEEQANIRAKIAGTSSSSGGSGGSVPPTGTLTTITGDPRAVAVDWDNLSKAYTKAIASMNLQTGLYGESLDLLRGKEKAAETEINRLIGILGTHVGNAFLTDQEIAFKRLSEEIQQVTSQMQHFQEMANSSAMKAADLSLQAQAYAGMNTTESTQMAVTLNEKAKASLQVSQFYQEAYNRLREELMAKALEDTLKSMKEELPKVFNGAIDFGSPENLASAQETVRKNLRQAQENLLQKSVENFAKILETTFTQESLTTQLGINSAAFKGGATSMPQGNPSTLLSMLGNLDLGALTTRTGEMFDTVNLRAALDALIGIDKSFKDIATGSEEADKVIKRVTEDLSKLMTAAAGTGSNSEMAKGFLAAEQAIQKTVAEGKNLEGVYKNLLEQLSAIDKVLAAEAITEGEMTTLVRERVKVEQAIAQALMEQAELAARAKGEYEKLITLGKDFTKNLTEQEKLTAATAAGAKKLAEEEAQLLQKKLDLQGLYQASVERGIKDNEKLLEEMAKVNKALASMGSNTPGMTSTEIQQQLKGSQASAANTKFATDVIDFAVWQVEWAAAANIVQGFFNAISEGIKTVIEFETVINKMAVISQASALETTQLSEELLKLSKVSPYSVKELGEGLIILGQAGFTASESMKLLPAITDLATASLETLKVAADIVTTAIEAYQLKVSESTKIANIMNATAIESKLDLAQVGTAFNYVASAAATSGLSVADTTTALGLMANAGLKASTAGTSLRSALGALMAPTAGFAAELAKVGLSTADVNPRFNDLGAILTKMRDAGFSVENAFAGLDKRMAAGMITLVQHSDQWVTFKDKIENGTSAAEQAEKQMYTFENATKALTHSFEALAVVIGESSLEPMGLLAKALQLVVNGITGIVNLIPNAVKEWAALTIAIGLGTSAVMALVSGFQTIRAASLAIDGATLFTKMADGATSTGKTVDTLAKSLNSLQAVFVNPAVWGWTAAIVGAGIALKTAFEYVSGEAALNAITKQVSAIESQLKAVKSLSENYKFADPGAAINVDITKQLKLSGFDIDVSNLKAWVKQMSDILDDLQIMQNKIKLENSTNWWANVRTWIKGLFDADAATKQQGSIESNLINQLKQENNYFDDARFQAAMAALKPPTSQQEIDARANVSSKRDVMIQEDSAWADKLAAEINAILDKALTKIKSESAADTVANFNLENENGAINSADPTTKNKIAALIAFLNSIGAMQGNDMQRAIDIYGQIVNDESDEMISTINAFGETRKKIAAKDIAKVMEANGGGRATGLGEQLKKLGDKAVATVDEFVGIQKDLDAKREQLAAMAQAQGDNVVTEEQTLLTAEIQRLEATLESTYGSVVNTLKNFFRQKLLLEIGAQMETMVKGMAPIAAAQEATGDTTTASDAMGVTLQEFEDFATKMDNIDKKLKKIKAAISDDMRYEIGALELGNMTALEQLELRAEVTVDPKRITKQVENGVGLMVATARATVEAMGEKIIEQKLQLWAALREKDATEEAVKAANAMAKKYFDLAQKGADELTASKVIELDIKMGMRTFSSKVSTEMNLAAAALENFSILQTSFVQQSSTLWQSLTIPSFSETQVAVAKMGQSFAEAQDGMATAREAYSVKILGIENKLKNELAFLDSSSITKSEEADSLYQRTKTDILKAGAQARLDAAKDAGTKMQGYVNTEMGLYNQLISKMNELRMAGQESYNSLMQLSASISPGGALSLTEVEQQVQKLVALAKDASEAGDKASVSTLNAAIASLINTNKAVTEGSVALKNTVESLAVTEQDNFEAFRSKLKNNASDIKSAVDSGVAEWKRLEEKSSHLEYTIDINGTAVAKEVFDITQTGVLGALEEVNMYTQRQIDYTVDRSKLEMDAMIKIPNTIKTATDIAQNNLIEFGVSMKSTREQADLLTKKFIELGQAANISMGPNGTPTTAKGMVINVGGEIKLTSNTASNFEFTQADMQKITKAVVTLVTDGLQE